MELIKLGEILGETVEAVDEIREALEDAGFLIAKSIDENCNTTVTILKEIRQN